MRHDHERGSSAVGSTATSLLQQVDGGDEAPDVGGGVIGPRTHKIVVEGLSPCRVGVALSRLEVI